MIHRPTAFSAALWLILFNAIFWLAYAVLVAFEVFGGFPAGSVVKWVMVVLALGCAAALAGSVVFLRRRSRLSFYFATVLLTLIAVLSITDEFGLLDLISLLLSLIPLGLLLKDRVWYLRAGSATSK